jgi:hypothetical protein
MQAYKETTIWDGSVQANHTCLLDGDNMVAYIKFGSGEPFYFKKPIRIDRRGRKFELVEPSPFDVPTDSTSLLIEVAGSKGAVYYIDTEARTCTCPGFTFRGSCKHIKDL